MKDLETFLTGAFTTSELLQWAKGDFPADVAASPPPITEEMTPQKAAIAFVDWAKRLGLLDDPAFWDSLIARRPRKRNDIEKIQSPGRAPVAQHAAGQAAPGSSGETPTNIPGPLFPRHGGEAFADEFLADGWKSWGTAEIRAARPAVLDGNPATVAWLDKATRLQMAGQQVEREEAVSTLRQWVQANPDHPAAARLRLRLVLCLKRTRKFAAAREALKPLLQSRPASAALQCLYGNLLGYENQFVESTGYFERAIALDGRWLEPRLQLMEALLLIGRFDDCTSTIDEALALQPDAREKLVLLAHRVVANGCSRAHAAYEREHAANDMLQLARVEIRPEEKEDWHSDQVREYIIKLPIQDHPHLTVERKTELVALLAERVDDVLCRERPKRFRSAE